MVEVITEILSSYNLFIESIPPFFQTSINLFFMSILLLIYCIFIWKFYNFVSQKNPLGLKLSRFIKDQDDFISRAQKAFLFSLEYLIIIPFLLFFWFAVFSFFMLVLSQNQNMINIFKISAILLTAIRMICYLPNYGKKLANELAKIIPITLLGIALLNSDFFSQNFLEKALTPISQLSSFGETIIIYLLFIIIIELILRGFDIIFSLFGWSSLNPQDNDDQEE